MRKSFALPAGILRYRKERSLLKSKCPFAASVNLTVLFVGAIITLGYMIYGWLPIVNSHWLSLCLWTGRYYQNKNYYSRTQHGVRLFPEGILIMRFISIVSSRYSNPVSGQDYGNASTWHWNFSSGKTASQHKYRGRAPTGKRLFYRVQYMFVAAEKITNDNVILPALRSARKK